MPIARKLKGLSLDGIARRFNGDGIQSRGGRVDSEGDSEPLKHRSQEPYCLA